LRFIKAIVVFVPTSPDAARGRVWNRRCRLIIEIGGATGLFGGHASQPHTFVGKEDGGSSEQELTELQDRIQSPTLKEKDAATQKTDRREENVVIPGKGGLERPHEIEERTANSKHDSNDACPVETGINH